MKIVMAPKIMLLISCFCIVQLLMAQDSEKDYWYPVIIKGKMGYIDKTGKLKINAEIERPASYNLNNVHNNFIVVGSSKKAIFNRQAKPVIGTYFNDIMIDESNQLIKVSALPANEFSSFNTKKGWYDFSGKEVIPVQYETQLLMGGYGFSEGLWCFEKEGKQGYMDTKGNIIIQPQFATAFDFRNGFAAAKKTDNEPYGYINKKGDFVIKPQFYDAGEFDSDGYAIVYINKTDKTQSIINSNGKILVKNLPYQVKTNGFSSAIFRKGLVPIYDSVQKKYGYMDHLGKTVIPIQYSSAAEFDEKDGTAWVNLGGQTDGKGLFAKTMGGKWALIDTKGTQVIPFFRAEEVARFSEGMAAVKMNGLWGFINNKGEIVIEPQWKERPDSFDGGLARITERTKTVKEDAFTSLVAVGYINKAGKFVWPVQE